jgi:hypothetical protein
MDDAVLLDPHRRDGGVVLAALHPGDEIEHRELALAGAGDVDVGVRQDVVGDRLRVVATHDDRHLGQALLEHLRHLRGEGVEIGQAAHRDDVGPERHCALQQLLVAIHPRQVGEFDEQVVVEARIEDQVDLVAVRLEHRHHVADAQVLDSPVVEENAHIPTQLV